MWNDPRPKWRKAMKDYACQGEDCSHTIVRGERYLDKPLRAPANTHHRYCEACGDRVMEYESIRRGNDFPDRYQQRIATRTGRNSNAKSSRSEVIAVNDVLARPGR